MVIRVKLKKWYNIYGGVILMKNIEKDSIKYLAILIITYVIMGLILYPLFDLIYCKLITNTKFVYSFQADVIKPISMGVIMGICLWVVEKNKKEK